MMLNLTLDPRFHTLGDILRWRAEAAPTFPLYTYLLDGETQAVRLTLGQLDRAARAIAATLQTMTRKGDRALLIYPSGLEFVAAFFGCLYAGVVAVPAPAPNALRGKRTLLHLQVVCADAQARRRGFPGGNARLRKVPEGETVHMATTYLAAPGIPGLESPIPATPGRLASGLRVA